MAKRTVFVAKSSYPFFEEIEVNFDWFGGFALSQRRKCEISLHKNFNAKYPHKVLEISSASLNKLGVALSAMNLKKKTARGITSVESAFQSSRIYFDGSERIDARQDLLFASGKECKRIVKEGSRGLHSYLYDFEGEVFPAPNFHISLFYDYLYLNALLEDSNSSVTSSLIRGNYKAFTDLATKALNSQARSCAIFVGLREAGLLDSITDYTSYLRLFRVDVDAWKSCLKNYANDEYMSKIVTSCNFEMKDSYENVQLLKKGGVQLLSPSVPMTFDGQAIEDWYRKYYSHLSNKKTSDGYKRLGVYDIDLSHSYLQKVCLDNSLVALRLVGKNGGIDIPKSLISVDFKDKNLPCISLDCSYDNVYISKIESDNRVLFPSANELNTDIIEKAEELLSFL